MQEWVDDGLCQSRGRPLTWPLCVTWNAPNWHTPGWGGSGGGAVGLDVNPQGWNRPQLLSSDCEAQDAQTQIEKHRNQDPQWCSRLTKTAGWQKHSQANPKKHTDKHRADIMWAVTIISSWQAYHLTAIVILSGRVLLSPGTFRVFVSCVLVIYQVVLSDWCVFLLADICFLSGALCFGSWQNDFASWQRFLSAGKMILSVILSADMCLSVVLSADKTFVSEFVSWQTCQLTNKL